MDRDERVKRFGIDCIGPGGSDGILFKAGTWRPGGEYIQKLLIRNVSTSVKKLKYKLPSTRYFSMAYPEPIVLSPGLSQEVDVIFRPVEYEPYDDTMYIKLLDGIDGNGFTIPVRATIDNLSLSAPSGLDLGYCTTHQTTQLTFHLVNTGEIDAPYEWDVPAPFVLVPSKGTVPVGKFHEITLSIQPTDASVYVAQAICRVGEGVHAIIPEPIITTKLSAIGKFAYITLSDSLVSFDEVVSGVPAEAKEIILYNNSVVPAEFQLIRLDTDREEVFDIQPKSGVIPPRSEVPVSIKYRALAMGTFSQDRYAYRTPGNCNTLVTLKGTSMPPKVFLYKDPGAAASKSSNNNTHTASQSLSVLTSTGGSGSWFEEGSPSFSLNFRDVEIGRIETRILFLCNESHRSVAYSIIADEHGVFQMSPKQGVIPPLTKAFAVTIEFIPLKPINYYRRFFVLVADALPLYYDCMGTGFIRAKGETKEQRPAPIRHAHIQAYRNRSVKGYGHLNPDELDSLYDSPECPRDFFAQIGRAGTRAMSIATLQRPVTRTGESIRTLVAPAHEFFIQETDDTSREVVMNALSLDFGFTPHHTNSQPQTVVVHNNTNGKLTVQWFIPIVTPSSQNENNSNEIVSRKTRNIITVDQEEVLRAEQQSFKIEPSLSDINPKQSMTFKVYFTPKQSNRNFFHQIEAYVYFKNQRTFRLVNDHSLTPPWCLPVSLLGHTFSSGQLLAKGIFSGGNIRNHKLIFPNCYQDEAIYQTVMIQNTSNLPCTFQLTVGWNNGLGLTGATPNSEEIFSVKPTMGEIAAENFTLVCIRFQPHACKKYTSVLQMIINGDEGDKLLLEGTGARPYIMIPDILSTKAGGLLLPEQLWGITLSAATQTNIPSGFLGELYLQPTCVGLHSVRTFTLKNSTRLPLKFRLSLAANFPSSVVTLSPTNGVLKGNEDIQITVKFAPDQIKQYQAKVQINVYPVGGKSPRVLDANQPGQVDVPEILQQCHFFLTGQGDMGALTFDPPKTEIPVRLVHTEEETVVWLENISDTKLYYKLYYQESFEADSVDQSPEMITSSVLSMVSKEQLASSAFQHSLYCEQPEGSISARSRLRVVFTYRAVKSGLFQFKVFAKLKVNPGEEFNQTTNEQEKEKHLLTNIEATRIHFQQSLTLTEEMSDEEIMSLPLTMDIIARAAFPKLLFEDIRLITTSNAPISDISSTITNITNVNYLWKKFSFSKINYDLSIPMTSDEITLNNSSSPDLSLLHVYPFVFTPNILNQTTQSFEILVRNHGYLPTTLTMHFPNEKQLELENWCDEENPSEEFNRLISIIEELKLFTVEPRHFTLLPQETTIVKISYRHSSLRYQGLHNIPILVKLKQGKQFYLDIRGQTLAQPTTNDSMVIGNNTLLANSASGTSPSRGAGDKKQGVRIVDPRGGAVTPSRPATGQVERSISTASMGGNAAADLLVVCGPADLEGYVRLEPIPLGLSPYPMNNCAIDGTTLLDSAPFQRIELINVSALAVTYDAFLGDIPPIPDPSSGLVAAPYNTLFENTEHIKRGNFHLPLLQILNPTGVIPANSSIFLEVYFYPLEEKKYKFPLTVRYASTQALINSNNPLVNDMSILSFTGGAGGGGGKLSRKGTARAKLSSGSNASSFAFPMTAPVPINYKNLSFNIVVEGYNPTLPKPMSFESHYLGGLPPIHPVLQRYMPDQPTILYQDFVDFGRLPQKGLIRRVLVLRNTSTTSTYEFTVDETSSSLCVDGFMRISPVFGKLEPQQVVLIEITLEALCQPMIVFEHLRLWVREILKVTTKSRAGARQQLLDKIKSRKTSTVEHESVVARATFTRSMQIAMIGGIDDPEEHAHPADSPNNEHKLPKYPNTIKADGKVATADLTSVKHTLRPYAVDPVPGENINGVDQLVIEDGGNQSTFSNVFSPGPGVSRVTKSAQGGGEMHSERGSRAGALISSHSSRMGGNTGASERAATGASRGSALSRTNLSESGSYTSHSNAPATRYGLNFTLFIRITGEIYNSESLQQLYQPRHADALTLQLYPQAFPMSINPFANVCPVFIPPIGKKLYQSDFKSEQEKIKNKAKVNLSMLTNERKHEIRCLTLSIFDILMKNLLNQMTITNHVVDVLSITKPSVVPLNTLHVYNPFAKETSSTSSSAGVSPPPPPLSTSTIAPPPPSSSSANATKGQYGIYYEALPSKQRNLLQQFVLLIRAIDTFAFAKNKELAELMNTSITYDAESIDIFVCSTYFDEFNAYYRQEILTNHDLLTTWSYDICKFTVPMLQLLAILKFIQSIVLKQHQEASPNAQTYQNQPYQEMIKLFEDPSKLLMAVDPSILPNLTNLRGSIGDSYASVNSSMTFMAKNIIVNVHDFLYTVITPSMRTSLHCGINVVHDLLRQYMEPSNSLLPSKIGSTSTQSLPSLAGNNSSEKLPGEVTAEEKTTMLTQLLQNNDFLSIASEAMNTLFVSMLQEEINKAFGINQNLSHLTHLNSNNNSNINLNNGRSNSVTSLKSTSFNLS